MCAGRSRVVARPSILTDELTAQVVALVSEGHYVETVCQSIGIHKDTYYAWLERADDDRAKKHAANTPHTRFSDAVKKAAAEAEIAMLRDWKAAGPKEWLKYAVYGSRRFRERWHDREPEQRNTYVQNNYALMPGQAGYVVPQLPAAIAVDVVSPPTREVQGESAQER